jgi:hypothetical protein
MKIPRVRDRVRVEGHHEVFVVVHVNERSGWADLACVERVGFLTQVPLRLIQPAEHDPPAHEVTQKTTTE